MGDHLARIKPESWLVSAGRVAEMGAPLNVAPIPASNFLMGGERSYSRNDGTPTWEALEEVVGGLELGRSVAFASGMAAVAALFDQLSMGASVVLPDDCYQGVVSLAALGSHRGRWSVQRVAVADTDGWIRACEVSDLIWIESLSNPLLTVPDMEAICRAPRKDTAILAVDSTFATPLNQRPLSMGATVALHSATKFIGGHSDLLAGVATTAHTGLWQGLRRSRELMGATPGALEAFLSVRGARTLAVRLKQAQKTALALSQRLENHPKVTCVRYPGLRSHPTHATARQVLNGFGTIISFDVRGNAEAADGVCGSVKLIRHATSLGAVESTIERRAALEGQVHLPPSLLRLSVGLEDLEDLWDDLESAIAKALPGMDG